MSWTDFPAWLYSDLPPRPRRRYFSYWTCASYWAQREVFWVDLEEPHCFGCYRTGRTDMSLPPARRWAAASSFLERAHLADFARDGLDDVQNIVPLCLVCHRLMPSFSNGHDAIRWVLAGGSTPVIVDKVTPMTEAFLAGKMTMTELANAWSKLTGISQLDMLQIVSRSIPKSAA